MIVSGVNIIDICFAADVLFFLFQHEISELSRQTAVKFCSMVRNRSSIIMQVQNFGEPFPQEKFRS